MELRKMELNKFNINIDLKSDFKEYLDIDNNEVNDNVQTLLAIGLFVEKKVTLSRAAEMSEKSLSEFVNILVQNNIAWAEYTDETMKSDGDTLNYIRSRE
jgi:predicted HTH domain antitoxin